MAGPWEQYQSSPASASSAPADGPWAQYGGQSGGEHGYAYAPAEEKPPAAAPVTTFDEYGRPLTDGVPPSMTDELGAAAKAHAPDVARALAPAPNTTYGDILPLAKDNTTGAIRLALPNMIRSPLIGLTEGPGSAGTFGSSAVTLNPQTGSLGLTPEASSLVPFAATPLGFSGKSPLQFEAPGTLERQPIPAGPAANILHPDAAARIRSAQGEPVPVPAPGAPAVSTPFNTPASANVVPGEGGIPTVNVTPQPQPGGASGTVVRQENGNTVVYKDGRVQSMSSGGEAPPQPEAAAPQQPNAAPSPAAAVPTAGAPATPAGPLVTRTGVPVTPPVHPLAPTVAADGTLVPPQAAAAGAQVTPAAELGITPAEEAAYRSTAEGNKLLEPQEPGVRDDKQYLPNERTNEAEASQDVETARNLKQLRQQTPKLDAEMTADENFNNNLRYNSINNAIPGQVQITAAKTARQAAMDAAEPKVFGNATDADVQPIVKDIQKILNDPKNRQNTQLGQYVQPLIDRLQNPDGTPKITDPKELWSFRQDVQHLTSGAAQAQDKNLSRVSGILGRVLDTTDNQIEAAAPGYKAQIRDDYRARSREIDAMEALNAERFKLFDTQNKPNYNAVQSLMRRIVDARQANDPYDAFTHVSQDTLDKLWNIRDSMRRTQAADRLAAPKGSPTSQNLGDALRAAGRMAVQNAAPAVGAGLGAVLFPGMPVVGSTAGLFAGTAINHLLSERALAQRLAEGRTLLQPNTLMQPPP